MWKSYIAKIFQNPLKKFLFCWFWYNSSHLVCIFKEIICSLKTYDEWTWWEVSHLLINWLILLQILLMELIVGDTVKDVHINKKIIAGISHLMIILPSSKKEAWIHVCIQGHGNRERMESSLSRWFSKCFYFPIQIILYRFFFPSKMDLQDILKRPDFVDEDWNQLKSC